MTLAELRALDIRDIGSWKTGPKVVVMGLGALLLLALVWAFDWSGQVSRLTAGRLQEQTLKTTFLEKKHLAVDLPAYQQQYNRIQHELNTFVMQLPNREEMPQLLSSINEAGVRRGLTFELFRPAKQEIPGDFYAELPITIRVSGHYHNMGQFVSDVAQLPRIVTLDGLNISFEDNGQLALDATAHTFRYMDAAEIAARKQAADAARRKKK